MSLSMAKLSGRASKVCLGDAFVYGFPRTPSYASNADAVCLFLASVMLTFVRVCCEC